jgi:hypothetical protein
MSFVWLGSVQDNLMHFFYDDTVCSWSCFRYFETTLALPFSACNVKRRNEPVDTDTVFSDTPAVDSDYIAAQLFVGRHFLVADAYGMKTDKEFVNTSEDNICEQGAMDKLISDCAKVEMGSCG